MLPMSQRVLQAPTFETTSISCVIIDLWVTGLDLCTRVKEDGTEAKDPNLIKLADIV